MSNRLFARLARRHGRGLDAVSRREFLRGTLAVGSGLLLSSPAFASTGRDQRRVLLIGAGFSGLACAHELLVAGYDVHILEGCDRVGGRVLSLSDLVPGKNVEGGAELIGSNHPTWVAYAHRFGLEFLDVSEYEDLDAPLLLDGRTLHPKEQTQIWDEFEQAAAKLTEASATIDPDEPWSSPNATALDAQSLRTWLDLQQLSPLTRRAVELVQTADNGVSVDRQSLLGLLAMIKGGGGDRFWTESEVYRCKGGNQQLAARLAAAIGPARILLKHKVASIRVDDRGVEVRDTDGRAYVGDDLVLAVPPPIWKNIDFDPPLPSALAPQMGSNIKHLSALKRPVWKDHNLSPDAVTDGDINITWDGTDGQGDDGPVGMVAFSGGPAADACRARETEARKRFYTESLDQLYPGYAAALMTTRFMDWPSDPWVGGSYTFPAPGQVTAHGPTLRNGLGRLHFAGEHCCYKFVGYMEGALNSGVSLARRITIRDGVRTSD